MADGGGREKKPGAPWPWRAVTARQVGSRFWTRSSTKKGRGMAKNALQSSLATPVQAKSWNSKKPLRRLMPSMTIRIRAATEL